jgi:hypothetical protein
MDPLAAQTRMTAEPPTLVVETLAPNDRWGAMTRRITQFL